MIINGSLSLLNGEGNSLIDGAVVAILCTIMVFVILALIIGITYFVNLLIQKLQKEDAKDSDESIADDHNNKLDLNDEDAVIASLIASIDYRNETKRNIKVITIKEIK